MEQRNNSAKILSIVALIIAVIGVTVGFAAFSSTLTISSSADVTPDASKFDVNFSSTNDTETDGEVIGEGTPATVLSEKAMIDNSTTSPKITGLKAHFTAPGQKVVYQFYAHNAGEYIAYLNSITFANVAGEGDSKICTAKTGTNQGLVDSACNDINITVSVGGEEYTGSISDISSHSLLRDDYELIEVTIEYNTNSEPNQADGDFDVSFGDISLVYSAVDLGNPNQ